MEKTSFRIVRPDLRKENKHSMHDFLRDSYTQAKKQIQGGINAFKDELREIRNTAEACLDFFALPVNNYLKDISQIDRDFESTTGAEPANTNIRIVAITDALTTEGPMEENY